MSRPFDLKAALSGEPVIYNGALYIFSALDDSPSNKPPRLLFSQLPEYGKGQMSLDLSGMGYCEQVYMAPRKVKKTVYVNFYKNGSGFTAVTYLSESVARINKSSYEQVATAVPVEIEVSE